MINFKGTKGKWIVDNNGYYFDIRILQTDEKVINASVFCNVSENGSVYQSCITDNETKANALLISKAPEMLEMLEKISELASSSFALDDYQDEIKQLIKKATEL